MRVLIVTGSLPPAWCGVGDHAARLVEAMARRSDVDVGVLTTEGDAETADVTVLRTADWRLFRVAGLLRKIRRFDPDVVHFQYPAKGYRNHLAPWVLPALCRIAGRTVVMTWHEPLEPQQLWIYLNVITPSGVVLVRPRFLEEMSRILRPLTKWKRFKLIEIGATIPFIAITAAERETVRAEFVSPADRLVSYFGFAFPHKSLEQLFEVANPEQDALVLICELNDDDPYHRVILGLANSERWRGRCFVTGTVTSQRVARLLAASDAVVLPFKGGSGTWNSSMRAASGQGTFVLTTSNERQDYDETANTYYARPGDIETMRDALRTYSGRRRAADVESFRREWDAIAEEHVEFYRELRGRLGATR